METYENELRAKQHETVHTNDAEPEFTVTAQSPYAVD